MTITQREFTRDRLTIYAYLTSVLFVFLQVGLGPMVNLLQNERNLDYTVAGFHFSAFSIGMIISGFITNFIARKLGRRIGWLAGGTLMAAGALIFALSPYTVLTVFGCLLMGICGTMMANFFNAAISDHHGKNRAIAISEINIIASTTAVLMALTVGGLATSVFGWRAAIYGLSVYWLVVVLIFGRLPVLDAPNTEDDGEDESLPSIFWLFVMALFISIAAEWCINYWGVSYLNSRGGYSPETSASLMSLYFLGILVSRIGGNMLLRYFEYLWLLFISLFVMLGGFVVFWLAPGGLLNVLGLVFAAFGTANTFPLLFSAAMAHVPKSLSNLATSRVAIAAGIAILVLPQLLGTLSDYVGIGGAFTVVPVLLFVLFVLYSRIRLATVTHTPASANI